MAPLLQNDSSAPQLWTSARTQLRAAEAEGRHPQFCSVQSSNHWWSSSFISIPFGATPWSTLWILRFVMSKIAYL